MRGIFYFLWDIEFESGAVSVLRSYAKAFRQAGIELDVCYLHSKKGVGYPDKIDSEFFDRVFVPPLKVDSCERIREFINREFFDSALSEMEASGASLYSGAQIIASGQYDFVGVHYTACHFLVDMLPDGIPKILFTHDLDSVVRQQKGNIIQEYQPYSLEDEISRLGKFDLVTVLGDDDEEILAQAAPSLPVIVAPFCVDLEQDKTTIKEMRDLIFVGLNVPFKRLSLQWFWSFVWPKLEESNFTGNLNIVGDISNFAIEIGMHKHKQCNIYGIVDDLDEWLKKSDLLLAPYYYGAGIKTIILHAASLGLPVITTKYGLTNTAFKDGYDIAVADNAHEFANMVMSLQDKTMRSELSINALNTLKKRHSTNLALDKMVNAVKKLVNQRERDIPYPDINLNLTYELNKRLPDVIELFRKKNINRIALYGAGTHTEVLLSIWHELHGPDIECILVSQSEETIFNGYKLVVISEEDNIDVDAILASSKSYEISMAIAANEYLPQVPFYGIWNPQFNFDHQKRDQSMVELSTGQKLFVDIP